MKQALVSVIITTRNSAGTLGELLESVKEQSYDNIEIIVVDNGSRDRTEEIAKEFTNKVFQKGPERSAQRNFGAKKAMGEYLLILDSDMILTKDVVKECVDLAEKDKDVKEIIVPEKSFGKGFWAKTKALERKISEREPYFESARFFLKKVFWEFGGFDESLTGPEDWDLPQSIAKVYKVGRIKSYIFHNEGEPTFLSFARRKYYYGLSAHKYLQKQGLPTIGPRTVYFLRPAFYRNWRKLLKDPLLSAGMFLMLFTELIAGGLGYLIGRMKDD